MERFKLLPLLAAVLLAAPCCSSSSGGSGTEVISTPDVADVADVAPDNAVVEVVGKEIEKEIEQVDIEKEIEQVDVAISPEDDVFRIGVAVTETPAPIGIPTAGYGQNYSSQQPHSPFTESFVATVKQHTPILAKTAYFRRGLDELLIIRLDKIGTTPNLLDELTNRLDAITGRSWDGKIVLASNHSHQGPGRLWESSVGDFANYTLWPHYYDLYVDSLAEVAIAAIKDAEPGKFGYGKTECPECHNDRRCENPELLDSTMWVLKLEREDGSLKAVILNFAIHGTVLGWEDAVLSTEAPGMIEHKLQEQFDTSVDVFLLQSWGGDVSPGDADAPAVEPVNGTIPGGYDRMERIGQAASSYVLDVLPGIETSAEIEFDSVTLRLPFSWELMDYEEGEWIYSTGGFLCGTNQDSHCWGEEGEDPFMFACLALPEKLAIRQITLSALHVGELMMFTIPGEPHTDLALEAAQRVREASGFEDVMVIGYANDHWGYMMKAYDWLLGGYEPTVSAWGPQQGEFFIELVYHVAAKLVDPQYALPYEPLGYLPETDLSGPPYVPLRSSVDAAVAQQPGAQIPLIGAAEITWHGGDPWFGTPTVSLQSKTGEEWEPVLCHNQVPWDNRTYLMESSLEMLPSWNDDKESQDRDFMWKVIMPAKRNTPTTNELAVGEKYRFHITGKLKQGGDTVDYELYSEGFEIE